MVAPAPMNVASAEGRHQPGEGPWWCERFWFGFWTPAGALAGGAFAGGGMCELTLFPNQARSWYRALLVRAGERVLVIDDVDAPMPRQHLELKSEGLWADHVCEVPGEQWTVANEAYAVALDDPEDAIGRGYGVPTAMAFDLEWYATGPIVRDLDETTPGGTRRNVRGYAQPGIVHGVVELPGGPLDFEAPAARTHCWGPFTLPDSGNARDRAGNTTVPRRLPAPFDAVVEDVLTPNGWLSRLR